MPVPVPSVSAVPVPAGSIPSLSALPVPTLLDVALVLLASDPGVDLTWPLPRDDTAPVADVHATGRWYASSELMNTDTWEDLCRRYADGIGTHHLAAGGACALQHWAGRFVKVLLGHWLRTGSLLETDPHRWWAWIDARAATRSITLDPRIAVDAAEPGVVVEALLDHVSNIVPGVREVSRITSTLAYGSVATSCAGVLGTAHRRVRPDQRGAMRALADEITGDARWPHDELVTLIDLDTPIGPRLTHERHTCCLIRLGDHGACATCRDLAPDERHRRLVQGAVTANADPPLTLANSLVAWAAARRT